MDSPSDRWAFLRPWCAPLRRRLAVSYDKSGRVPVVEYADLRVEPPTDQESATPAEIQTIRDALVLLSLVARVDPWAWKHVLEEHCGVDMKEDGRRTDSAAFCSPLFVFRVADRDDDEDWSLNTLQRLFSELETPSPTAHLVAMAMRKIVTCGIADRDELIGKRMDIPIILVARSTEGREEVEEIWRSIKGTWTHHGDRRCPVRQVASAIGLECAFRLEPIVFAALNVDSELALQVEDMVTNSEGLAFSNVALSPYCSLDAAGQAQVFGRLAERVLCASSCPREKLAVVESLMTELSLQHCAQIARVCSAIAETQTADQMMLALSFKHMTPDERAWTWRWLAFALVSSHSRSHSLVTSAVLTGVVMTEADAEAFATIVSSADPIRQLLDGLSDGVPTDRGAIANGMLKRGTRLTLQQMHADEDLDADVSTWALETDVCGVTVMARAATDPDLVVALVPGYGFCEVRRSDITTWNDAPRSECGVSALTLHCKGSGKAVAGLGRLLELVGSSLTRLQLVLEADKRALVPVILRCCPNLKTLIVKKAAVDVEAFLDAYRASEAQIEELYLRVEDLQPLARELGDCTTRLAKTLKRLECKLVVPTWHFEFQDPLQCVTDMLRSNRTVEYLHLTVPSEAFQNSDLDSVTHTHNTLLPVVREPFPLACRLAFLGVFTPRSEASGSETSPPSSSVVARLSMDRHVLSRIFQLAAPNAVRRVYVKQPSDW